MAVPVFPGESQRRLTIQTKLSGVILALVASIVVPFAALRTGSPGSNEARLRNKVRLHAELAARGIGSALARGDQAAAREVLQSLSVDPDFTGVGLYTAAGDLRLSLGAIGPRRAAATLSHPSLEREGRIVRALIPLESGAGPSGALVLELSLDTFNREQSAALRAALMMGGGALVLGLLAAWLIGRSFARRVCALSDQATAVAAGDLSRRPLQDESSDEIGQMARAFKAMVDRIRTLITQMKESAKQESQRLERLVEERTGQLGQRNAEMRLMFDNVDQGFVTLDRDGRLSQKCSRILETWLGPPMPRIPFADWLFQADANQLALFELGWAALIEAALPRDLLLDQLPRRVVVNGRTIDLTYRPIEMETRREGTAVDVELPFDRLLVVMTDVTGELARVRAERAQGELASVMERYGRDRTSTVSFFEEARVSCRLIGDGTLTGEELLRALHTLKGNARLVGLNSFSAVCHELENAVAAEGAVLDADRARLRAAWDEAEQRLGFLFGARDKIEIAEADFAAVARAVESNAARADILRMLEACRAESLATRFQYFADQARRIAESLDKLPLEISLEAAGLSLPRGALSEFWATFVHVIRNAVDHGLEGSDQRAAAGKPAVRRLALRARVESDTFLIEVEDDGRGIAWEAVRARARAAGLPALTKDDLVHALCADGVSTRTEVSELSGRGVGMAAVRNACAFTGGTLQVDSEPGRGALLRFRWPAKRLGVLGARLPTAPPSIAPPRAAPGDAARP
jgi:two-component system chemotaxis sensor kinase CheA